MKKYPMRRLKYNFGFYGKKRCAKKRGLRCLLIFALMLLIISVLLTGGKRLCDIALLMSQSKINNIILQNINSIIAETIDANKNISSVLQVERDETGIKSVIADYNRLNCVRTELERKINEYISSMEKVNCFVPLGASVSDNLLIAHGPEIPVAILTTGTASVKFRDEFTSAGINQTKYTISFDVEINAKVHTYLSVTEQKIASSITAAEILLVGDVPNYMFNK